MAEGGRPVGYESDPHLGEPIIDAQALERRITEMGIQIADDYTDRAPLLVAILKGAFVFLGDLVRAIPMAVEVDFMDVSSYESGTTSTGVVRILKDLDVDITGRHVLLVEDIVDSGFTLAYLREALGARNPGSLEVCTLLARAGNTQVNSGLAYVGFEVPAEFVVGYGLDLAERYRDLPAVYLYER